MTALSRHLTFLAVITSYSIHYTKLYDMLPSISGDGRYVAFASAADNLVPDDNNEKWDVFVFDRNTKRIERISVNNVITSYSIHYTKLYESSVCRLR